MTIENERPIRIVCERQCELSAKLFFKLRRSHTLAYAGKPPSAGYRAMRHRQPRSTRRKLRGPSLLVGYIDQDYVVLLDEPRQRTRPDHLAARNRTWHRGLDVS